MELLHAESSALGSVSPDSIQRFATKVETYASQNPASQADPLWPEIIENIKSAAHGANITLPHHHQHRMGWGDRVLFLIQVLWQHL